MTSTILNFLSKIFLIFSTTNADIKKSENAGRRVIQTFLTVWQYKDENELTCRKIHSVSWEPEGH